LVIAGNSNELKKNDIEDFKNIDNKINDNIPIKFLEKVDFPHYGYVGKNLLID